MCFPSESNPGALSSLSFLFSVHYIPVVPDFLWIVPSLATAVALWNRPKQSDFVQFLADSLHVYEYFEEELMVADSSHPEYARFADTGLERVASLKTDLAYLASLGNPTPPPTAAATKYVDYLKGLEDKPEAVICHWYNYYFAHTAGGRMIGRKMQDQLFEGRELAFYMWEEDVSDILNRVRGVIDEVAGGWPRDVKDDCLEETGLSFAYSGTVLSNLAKAG